MNFKQFIRLRHHFDALILDPKLSIDEFTPLDWLNMQQELLSNTITRLNLLMEDEEMPLDFLTEKKEIIKAFKKIEKSRLNVVKLPIKTD